MQGDKYLLEWCKEVTSEYDNVKISDWTRSWKDGLAMWYVFSFTTLFPLTLTVVRLSTRCGQT